MTSTPPGEAEEPAQGPGAAPTPPAASPPPTARPTPVVPGEGSAPAAAAEPVAGSPPTSPGRPLPQHRIERTRAGGLWVAVAAAMLVLLFLLIFILQNGQQVRVSFLGANGHLPLGVAMLLSAVAGALLVVLVGAARIVQLRLVARRHRGRDAALPPS
jgi:uncharacterized integral membrane protein